MARKPVTNNTDKPKYVGGQLIPPGQTRWVEVHEPEEAAPEAPATDLQEALKQILEGSVKDIIPVLKDQTDDALAALLELENAKESPRKTLIEAINLQLLQNADDREQADRDAAAKAAADAAAASDGAGEGGAGGEGTGEGAGQGDETTPPA